MLEWEGQPEYLRRDLERGISIVACAECRPLQIADYAENALLFCGHINKMLCQKIAAHYSSTYFCTTLTRFEHDYRILGKKNVPIIFYVWRGLVIQSRNAIRSWWHGQNTLGRLVGSYVNGQDGMGWDRNKSNQLASHLRDCNRLSMPCPVNQPAAVFSDIRIVEKSPPPGWTADLTIIDFSPLGQTGLERCPSSSVNGTLSLKLTKHRSVVWCWRWSECTLTTWKNAKLRLVFSSDRNNNSDSLES